MTSQPDFNPSCPSGGSWYACGNGTRFTGCCGKYPCTDTGCPAGLLYPASFENSKYGTFPDQECSAGLFYTCNFTIPSFMGCCESGACASTSGCPSSDLAAAFLSNQPNTAEAYDPQPPLPGAATPEPSSSASSTALPVSKESKGEGTPVGVIAGAAIGGFAAICAIIFIIWRVKYHSTRSSRQHGSTAQNAEPYRSYNAYAMNEHKGNVSGGPPLNAPYQDSPSIAPPYSGYASPAPRYQSPQRSDVQSHPDWILEADSRGVYRQHSPTPPQTQNQGYPPSSYQTPYDPVHSSPGFSHSRSQSHSHTASWRTRSITDESYTNSTLRSQQTFVRARQGPPLEMDDDSGGRVGLGMQYVIGNHRPRAELGDGRRSPM